MPELWSGVELARERLETELRHRMPAAAASAIRMRIEDLVRTIVADRLTALELKLDSSIRRSANQDVR